MDAEVGLRWGLTANCDAEVRGEKFVYCSKSVARATSDLDVGCDALPAFAGPVTDVEGSA